MTEGDGAASTRCGFVAIVGAPNAGKSTLLNRLVGAKIAIVTPKVQTTRSRITAIAIEADSQLVFVDTPGIFQPRRRLDRAMVDAAWSGASDADLVLLLVDVRAGVTEDVQRILDGLHAQGRRAVLALNKIDLVKREKLLALAARLDAEGVFERIFMISALDGDGVDDLKKYLAQRVPEGPWLYPEDQLALAPMREIAAEITREKIFLRLHQELPYAITVETESWQERKDGSARLEQTIFVERPGHKSIVLGKGGRTVKAIGQDARKEMEAVFGFPVHLFLFVKLKESWQDDPERYRAMGLDYPRKT